MPQPLKREFKGGLNQLDASMPQVDIAYIQDSERCFWCQHVIVAFE